jgi:hypothetical protein
VIAVLDRLPLGGELVRIDREVRVLDAFESGSGQVVVTTIRVERCDGTGTMQRMALDVLRDVLENRDRDLRDAVAVVCIERIGGRTRVVEAYEVAPLRALFDVLEELGRVFCPACRVELNCCDEQCWKCGASVAHREAA